MKEVEEAGLTERQHYWLEHIRTCEASGKSVAEYATELGVKAHAMYAGKQKLVEKGILPRKHFVWFQQAQVVVMNGGSEWRIRLPNGVSVAFVGEVDAGALATILSTAASVT